MSNKAVLEVEVVTEGAKKSLKDFESKAGDMGKNVGSAFTFLKVAAAAAVAVFASKQVIDFFESGIEAAVMQEQAMASLAQQLKATGSFSNKAMTDFAAFADQMELTTTHGDDLIISQLAVAKAMGLTNSQSQDLVRAATELSAVTGDSLATSVEALGKTYEGITGRSPVLREALRGITKEALASGAGIRAVQAALGGSAEAQINTYAGSIKQAENAFGNLQESFGKIIIENPALLATIKAVTDIFVKMQAEVNENEKSLSDFVTLGVEVLAFSLTAAMPILGFTIRAFQGLSNAASVLVLGMLELNRLSTKLDAALFGGEAAKAAAVKAEAASEKFGMFFANNVEAQEKFNLGFKSLQDKVDGAALKIAEADNATATSSRASTSERAKNYGRDAEASKGREAAIKSFSTLEGVLGGESSKVFKKWTDQKLEQLNESKKVDAGIGTSAQSTLQIKTTAIKQFTTDYKSELSKIKISEDAANASSVSSFKTAYAEKVSTTKTQQAVIAQEQKPKAGSTTIALTGSSPGFARGLTEVPSGFPNDTFPARLTSGERVVDSSTNGDLKEFLSSAGGAGFGNQEAIALLRQIAANMGMASPQTIEVTIDKKVLGRTILDLNRRNERVTV